MIYLYSGTPGSGKSLHVAKDIYYNLLKRKRPVIANFPIDMDLLTKNGNKKAARFTYVDNTDLTVQWLVDYAFKNHKIGKEGQCTVYIDECQVFFNPREYTKSDRMAWINFFTQHRKLGYHFILISQNDRLIDRQIRGFLEYEVKHRKLNNFGPFVLLPVPTFVTITYWYSIREKVDREFFFYKRKYSEIYNSFFLFDGSIKGFDLKHYNNNQRDIEDAAQGKQEAIKDEIEILPEPESETVTERPPPTPGDGGRGDPIGRLWGWCIGIVTDTKRLLEKRYQKR